MSLSYHDFIIFRNAAGSTVMSESSMIIDGESKMHVSHSNDNVTLSQELEVMIF